MRRAFKRCCESRNSLVDLDAIMFSWKKKVDSDSDVESQYSEEWLFHHRFATLCLEKNAVTEVVDELAYLFWSKDRSTKLAELIKLCLYAYIRLFLFYLQLKHNLRSKDDLGILAKRFLRGYILDYDAPR